MSLFLLKDKKNVKFGGVDGMNYICILSVFFMYLYNSNARFTPYSSILHLSPILQCFIDNE